MGGLDVREAQAAVAAAEAHQHRLEEVAPLQEVQTDHRRYEDGHLSSNKEQTTMGAKVRPADPPSKNISDSSHRFLVSLEPDQLYFRSQICFRTGERASRCQTTTHASVSRRSHPWHVWIALDPLARTPLRPIASSINSDNISKYLASILAPMVASSPHRSPVVWNRLLSAKAAALLTHYCLIFQKIQTRRFIQQILQNKSAAVWNQPELLDEQVCSQQSATETHR